MNPKYLYELAREADPDELWRLGHHMQRALSEDRRRQLDAGVALRRYADYQQKLSHVLKDGRSLLVTPFAENSYAVMEIDTPPQHEKLRVERKVPLHEEYSPTVANEETHPTSDMPASGVEACRCEREGLDKRLCSAGCDIPHIDGKLPAAGVPATPEVLLDCGICGTKPGLDDLCFCSKCGAVLVTQAEADEHARGVGACRGMLQGERPPQSCIDRRWCEHNGKCFDQTLRATEQRIVDARGVKPSVPGEYGDMEALDREVDAIRAADAGVAASHAAEAQRVLMLLLAEISRADTNNDTDRYTAIKECNRIAHRLAELAAGVKPSPGAQPLRARALTEGEVAQLKHGADRSDALFALNVLRKFCHMHGIVLTDWDGNDAAGVATPPDNRTRPLTDSSQPWTPEHCKAYPRRAAEEIEWLRGQLIAHGVMGTEGGRQR